MTRTRATIIGAALVTAAVLGVAALVAGNWILKLALDPAANTAPTSTRATAPAGPLAAEAHQGFIYGRITTVDGATHEGRFRWGRDQEAFWSDYFNGTKHENRWAVHSPDARPRNEGIEIFGIRIGDRDEGRFRRSFMARFGDVARIDAHVRTVQVTLKSGTMFELDRFAAGDIDDGARVWDSSGRFVDLDARQIRIVEFFPTARLAAAPDRLHGTVFTREGDFTGFIKWDQEDGASDDELVGRTGDGERRLRFGTIRSIARHSRGRALVTLAAGGEIVLSSSREVGDDNRGIYVDDSRYGRVLISWDAFERVDFTPGGGGPAYMDFAPGRPLAGSVTTRDGRRLAGRLVYDFDESETTETFDATLRGVDYNIPFGLIASVVRAERENATGPARVILRAGEELPLERSGDFGERIAGLLIFVDGRERPDYVSWTDVERIDFERPSQ